MSIADKVIIVTGGTSGIGEGCTRYFAACGAKVITSSIQRGEGESLERELRDAGREARFVYCDVSDDEDVGRLVAQTLDIYGRVDGAMANVNLGSDGCTGLLSLPVRSTAETATCINGSSISSMVSAGSASGRVNRLFNLNRGTAADRSCLLRMR